MARRRTTNRSSTRAVITGENELMARLNRLANDLKKSITEEALLAGAAVVKREAARNAPGSIAQSIVIELDDRAPIPRARIGPDKDHWWANIIEFGARRHRIKIKTKTVLTEGQEFYGKEINHPGFRKRPFMRPALDDNRAEIEREMGRVIARRLGARQ